MKKMKLHPIIHLLTKRINSMKKVACTLLLLALATTISHAQTYIGDLRLESQAAIDTFNFTEVTGNLTISDVNIRNLDGLSGLTEIGGLLSINNNPSLISLDGLASLTSVGGLFQFFANNFLTSLSGLGSLTEIGGGLNIFSNTSLTSLSGLDSLTSVGGVFEIRSNRGLASLSGLEMLDSIGGTLTITGNTVLTDFCAISSLIGDDKQITSGEYTVNTNSYNPPYRFINNKNFCSNADGRILIDEASVLRLVTQASIDAFRYRAIMGSLIIDESVANAITNLDGLSGLTEIGEYLSIRRNSSLTSLSGLDSLTEVGDIVTIWENPSLTSLNGLGSLTEIGNLFDIFRNSSLMSLSGLESLTKIRGYLDMNNNPSLRSVSGLASLTEIGGYLSMFDNPSLTSLSGLEMLDSIGGDLRIRSNTALTDFCAISSLIGDDKQITEDEYGTDFVPINNNGYNPPYTFIQNESLCSNADGGIFVGNLTLTSQAAIDTFNYRGVTGNLDIQETIGGNITNLDSLESLIAIGGKLRIQTNSSLPSLSGLEMLDSIGNTLTITLNPALTDFCAISSLIGDDKQITSGEYTVNTNGYNPSYAEIQSADGCFLSIFDGDLAVTNQASIDAFRYRGITGNLTIDDTDDGNITNLDGLESLTEIGGLLHINRNNSLMSLSGLDSLTEIGGNLLILFNVSLTSLSGLEMLDSIGGTLAITGNTALTDFCAVSSLIGDDKQITEDEYGTEFVPINDNGYNPSFEAIQSRCSQNPPAVVATLQNVTTRSTVPFATINVAPVFSAPNRDTLTYTATSSDEAIITVAVTDSTLTLTEVSTGMATITVTATDTFGLSVNTSFMAIITPNNPPVVENPLAAIESVSGTAFAPIDISATFSDPDGDVLTYTVTSSNTAIVTAALNNSILTLTETGTGTATITVTASDAFGLSVDTSFMVAITTNTAPTVATALTDVSIESGTAFETIDISATFIDPNGDTLTYTVTSSDAAIVTVALNNTILTLMETGKGMATITVTASDGTESASSIFMVTITNTAPTVATALTDVTIESGSTFETIDLSATFSDPNGDALTYTVTSSDAAIVAVAVTDSTLTLMETGKGMAIITVTASDGPESVSDEFMVTITNTAPTVATALTDVAIESGSTFETIDLSATFSDPNGDALTYTVTSSDAAIVAVAVTDSTLTLMETGKGMAIITVTASDGPESVSDEFMVTITNTAPTVATALTDVAIESGTAFETIDLSATFSDENGDALSYTAMSDNETVVTVSVSGDTLTLTEVGTGTATITVTASDAFGLSVNTSFMVTITTNTAPTVATALTDVSIESGTAFAPIDLSATFSDPNGDALTYTVTSSDAAIVTAALSNTTLTLMETGKGMATITVTASDGPESVSDEFMVTITNTAPTVATALTDVEIVSGTAFETIDLSATFSDPNGDALTYTVISSDAAIVTAALNNSILTLTETGKGMATITVTASDGPESVSDEFMVTITNTAPTVATALANIVIIPGAGFAPIDLSATFSDPDGDALTYTVASSDDAIVTVALNNTILTLTEAGTGTATSTATITVTASDGTESASSIFMVTITNTAPTVATALTDVTIESGSTFETIDLSATFSDPNGDALTYTVTSSDAAIVTAALNNTTLTLTETGKGMATITVTASDGTESASSIFMVTITNTAPTVATALTDVEIVSGTAFETIDLSATFSDPNGDALTYTVISSDAAIVTAALNNSILTLTETGKGMATITVTASDGPESVSDEFMVTITNTAPTVATALTDVEIVSGTAFETIDLSATFSDPNGDALTYTVISSDAAIVTAALNNSILTLMETGKGIATITVTATDGTESASSIFMVTITNTAPTVATALTDVSIESGTAFETIDLSATFSDPNGDALTYTVTSSDAAIVTAALSNTTLTLTEAGKGIATITVTATDGTESASSIFMVTITNTAPTVATALTDVSIESGTAFETIDISATFSDPDALTYTVATSDASIVTAALNGTTLTLTETGKGTATITVTATDGDGASVDETFMVTISSSTNTSPIRTPATFISSLIIRLDYAEPPTSLTPFFTDPDGDVLEFSVESSDITIVTAEIVNESSFNFTPVSIGSATLTITATDPGGLSVSDSVMITVEEGETTLGIADTDILALYPNPSSGVFQLSRTADVVRVYDMSGRLVYRGRNTKQLDLTSQPSGQYLVEVRVGKERGRYTIIRE